MVKFGPFGWSKPKRIPNIDLTFLLITEHHKKLSAQRQKYMIKIQMAKKELSLATKVVRFCLLLEKGTKISAIKMHISIYPNIHSINSSTQDLLINRSNKFWLISYLLIFRQLPIRYLRKIYKINRNKLFLLHNTTPKFWHCYSCPKFNYSCRKALKSLINWLLRFSRTLPRRISVELCKS